MTTTTSTKMYGEFFKWAIPGLFSLYLHIFNTVDSK